MESYYGYFLGGSEKLKGQYTKLRGLFADFGNAAKESKAAWEIGIRVLAFLALIGVGISYKTSVNPSKNTDRKYSVKGAENVEVKMVSNEDPVGVVKSFNRNASELVDKYLLSIPKHHNIKIMETPVYLRSSIPEAAIYALDTFKKPYSLLFVTPSKHVSKASLLDTLVHENHGHCLNYTYLKCTKLRKISTGFSLTISDGLSVAMEYQFHDLVKKLGDKEIGFMKDFMQEFDFAMEMRKIIIPLRAVCDIRVNLGKQSLSGFVDEMNELTGIGKEHLFNLLLPRQFEPGYAVVYGTMGIRILELMKESKLSQKQFNAKAYSLGFPHRSLFEAELRE